MMKGYLTIFLSLSLSLLTGFILLLTGNAIRNAGKIRFECAVDTGMNAVLSEFHTELFKRYGLIYVDASYLGKQPSISNLEERLWYYIEENTSKVLEKKNSPWGSLQVEKVFISDFETAAADMGASMRNQAICFVEDTGISGRERNVPEHKEEISRLDNGRPAEEWQGIMEHIAGMELPYFLNDEGIWEEVPLSNPADWVYGMAKNDALFLAKVDLQSINPAKISLEQYISHRQINNSGSRDRQFQKEEDLFLSYLFNKLGCYGNPRESSLLCCQLEYVAEGNASDLENMRAVAERLFRIRFADNVACALADHDLRSQALMAAEQLYAVQLKEEFKEPVAESILYACAFLESISDVQVIYGGGTIPVKKNRHNMSVMHVLGGNLYSMGYDQGWSYKEYLAGMILLAKEETINLRAMDIMEMDIRFHDGNHDFKMDWCIERYEANVSVLGGYGSRYDLRRKYGYF